MLSYGIREITNIKTSPSCACHIVPLYIWIDAILRPFYQYFGHIRTIKGNDERICAVEQFCRLERFPPLESRIRDREI